MPRAKLALTIPEGVWIGDLSRSYPETRFRVLAALPAHERGVGLVEVVSNDHETVLVDMRSREEIADLYLLQHHGDVAVIQFETTNPFLLFPARDANIALEMPFEIQDGGAIWKITASRERLSALGEQLTAFGISFEVKHIYQHIDSRYLLTGRQRRIVIAAIEKGYYDTPRNCSLTELADSLGVAKSTCSEILHRAEGKIVKQFVVDDSNEAAEATGTGE